MEMTEMEAEMREDDGGRGGVEREGEREQEFYCFRLISGKICSDGKASACNAGDMGLIPGLGRSPGEGNGNPLQYPCLENFMGRGAWHTAVHGVAKTQTRLSD